MTYINKIELSTYLRFISHPKKKKANSSVGLACLKYDFHGILNHNPAETLNLLTVWPQSVRDVAPELISITPQQIMQLASCSTQIRPR